ncbi:CD1375 family protein [Schleiferilactobacillus harbinensis]|nr:CD1375 family protein [Schleiferilactobacillus harbinensis]
MLNFKFPALAALYAANVLDGNRTIDTVPEILRADVQTLIDQESTTNKEE